MTEQEYSIEELVENNEGDACEEDTQTKKCVSLLMERNLLKEKLQ